MDSVSATMCVGTSNDRIWRAAFAFPVPRRFVLPARSSTRHGRRFVALVAASVILPVVLLLAVPPPVQPGVVSVRVTDRTGALLRELRPEGRGAPVRLRDVPPFAVQALIATEDRRFYRHAGVDPRAIARAAASALRHGRVTSGASTIPMQVARALRGRSRRGLLDKLLEAHLALRLDLHLTKAELLRLWFERTYFGDGVYGLEAAAAAAFGKSARDLTRAEAALLVGLAQRPSAYDPRRAPERALARRRRVLDACVQTGVLTAADARTLAGTPLALAPEAAHAQALHLTELLRGALPPGTAEVRTTLDGRLQRAAEALVRTHVARLTGTNASAAAALVLDNATGDVLAYVGSADYWDQSAQGRNDGVRALRQPGSALKPFTYALALESRRYTAATILPDVALAVPEAGGAFRPQNYDRRFHGPVPLRQALASSFNVPAVVLAREIGPPALLRALHSAGFATLDRGAETYGVGLTLGNGEVRLEDLAAAYAGLARGGLRPALRTVRFARTARGDTLPGAPVQLAPMGISPATAYLVTDMLSDDAARAPGFGRGGPLALPFPVAVKTGTSKDYRDNWAVGSSPRHTVAVWVGRFDGAPMRQVSGVSGAAPLLHALFLEVGAGGAFAMPRGVVTAEVCPHSGHRPGSACPGRRVEVFLAGTAPADTCRTHRRVALDRRTGLRADATTPAADRTVRLFTDYGPVYHAWMRARGMPLPPTATAATARRAGPATASDRLRVDYPAEGARFLLDPHLRRAYQRLPLRAVAETGLLALEWRLDGHPAGHGPRLDWPLAPGRHVAEVVAVDESGRRLRSRPVAFTVE
jgi:penicillin-binding protein 1C